MNKKILITGGIVAVFFLVVALVFVAWGVSTYNRAQSLKQQITAKEQANTTVFDNMWKKISQSSQVTDAQKDALKEIFVGYAQARSGGNAGGSFINAVREAIPHVDTKVFLNLQNIITGARDEWTANQVALVDIGREYNTLLAVFPTNVLLRVLGFTPIQVKLVTSERTDTAFRTGQDNDVRLKPISGPK